MKNWKTLVGITLLLALAGGIWFFLAQREAPIKWRTATLEKGDINKAVTATGTLNPHLIVQVGTQVSGTLAKVQADFNSHVKKGQILAVLDTVFLYAVMQDAQANLRKAAAQDKLTSKELQRSKMLLDKGLAAQVEWEQADANAETAKANVQAAQSQLARARINLRYATIRSPIDGIVIARQVDPGQTVAASFSTPTLFSIADDLGKMEVRASIDEADIGAIHQNQQATFRVDAYPEKTFNGLVTEVRLQPTTVQNVVEYTVILTVDNKNQLLLPGMTANISLQVESHAAVLKVPSAALKFNAPQNPKEIDSLNMKSKKGNENHEANKGKVFILENGKPHQVTVTLGLSDGGYTEVTGDLAVGQLLILGQIETKASAAKNAMPGSTPPMGGSMRRF